jgi:arginyl-tRNA synthetase
MVFRVATQVGYARSPEQLVHVPFGSVHDVRGRRLMISSNGTLRLEYIMDIAAERAGRFGLDQRRAAILGADTVKYSLLAASRQRDYRFSLERMLSDEGNSAVSLRTVLKQTAGPEDTRPAAQNVELSPQERVLGLLLEEFPDAIGATLASLEPHRMCTYLRDVAQAFAAFHERTVVLETREDDAAGVRAMLRELTHRTITVGLRLLGMAPSEWQ